MANSLSGIVGYLTPLPVPIDRRRERKYVTSEQTGKFGNHSANSVNDPRVERVDKKTLEQDGAIPQ